MSSQQYTIYIIGGEGSGKTCFFAGLSILEEADRLNDIQIVCLGEGQAVMNNLAGHIRQGSWPPSTSELISIEAYLYFDNKDIDVRWIDYPGEMFVEQFMGKESETNELFDYFIQADFLLIALDPTVDLAGDKAFQKDSDYYHHYKERIDALQDALLELRRLRDEEKPLKVALVITKADLLKENVSKPKKAKDYLRQKAPAFYENLYKQFPDMQTFAVSAVGNTNTLDTGEVVPAQDLNPWGYNEIFKWIVKEIRSRKLKPVFRWVFSLLIVSGILLGSGFGYLLYQQKMADRYIAGIERRNLSESNKRAISEEFKHASDNAQQEAIDDFLESTKNTLKQNSIEEKELSSLLTKVQVFISEGNGYRAQSLYQVKEKAQQFLESSEYQTIKQAYEANAADFIDLTLDFLKAHPKSTYKDQIEQMMERWKTNQLEKDRLAVADITVRGTQGLRQKAKAIQEFITQHPTEAKEEMRNAVKLALNLANQIESQKLNIEFQTLGKLKKENELKLEIFVGNGNDPEYHYKSEAKIISFAEKKETVLDWRPSEDIQVEVKTDTSWNPLSTLKLVGYKNISDPLAISALDGSLKLESKNEGYSYFQGEIILTSDVIGWEKNDWLLLHDYIAPGKKWLD